MYLNLRKPLVYHAFQRGSTLIEVLVTVLLVSLGLMALTGMQVFSVAANKNALLRGVAAQLSTEMSEMMRANPNGFNNYTTGNFSYTSSFTQYSVNTSNTCEFPNCNTAALVASNDIEMMRKRIREQLPGGQLHLESINNRQARLWILWEEAQSQQNTRVDGGIETTTEDGYDSCPAGLTQVPRPRCMFFRVNL